MVPPRHASASARLAVGLCLGLCFGGCSMSFPLPGFVDKDATGTVKARSARLWPDLDQEDWRRANAALAVALDPQGNGADVTWDNPKSGVRGSFVAAAAPFLDHDKVCRAFKAAVASRTRRSQQASGSACRDTGGEWVLAELKAVAAPEPTGSPRK